MDVLLATFGQDKSVSFGSRLWVRLGNPKESLRKSAEYTFIREEIAKKYNEPFSKKVVITGICPEEKIRRAGDMNDESEYIERSFPIDRVFLITGEYENPIFEDITSQIIPSII